MKNKITSLTTAIFILGFTITSYAFTNVPGGNVSGHWTLAGSPYNIQGNVQVPDGATLIIDPGVTVAFQTSSTLRMKVNGCVLAIGTPSQPIYITASNHTTGFGGFRFDSLAASNDTSKFIYCNIQYGMDAPTPYINGGAFYFSSWSKAIISYCTIENCQAPNGNGGAIYCSAASPVITNDTISNNSTANYGGAIYIQNDTNETIAYCTMSNNSSQQGGAIYGTGVTNAGINNCSITYNTASSGGGGVLCYLGTMTSVNNNNISFNTISSGSTAGGLYLGGITATSVDHNTITYNTVPNAFEGGGGGVDIDGSGGPSVITSFSYNNVSYNTLGVDCAGAGIYLYQCTVTTMAYDTISNNNAGTNGNGGGIDAYTSTINLISNSAITNNTADVTVGIGGGVNLYTCSPTMLNVTISENNAYQGGGLYCDQASKPNLYNCILWNDSATATSNGGNEMYQNDGASAPSFYYCDVYGGKAAFGLNSVTYKGTYSNDINANPLFVSPSGGPGYTYDGMLVNWGIQKTSPCFNTGDPSYGPGYPATDLAGATRVTVCRIDMGAYENQYAQPLKLTVSTVNTVCGAVNTGIASVAVSGGSGPITYLWKPGNETTDTIKALPAGTYSVTVSEGTGCTKAITATVVANPTMTASFTQTPPPCNGGGGGTATITISNGKKPYTYSWSPSSETTQTATNLSGTTYTCTVTDSNGCQIMPTVTINQPTAVTLTKSRTDASCSGNDGVADISATGGIAPYTYLWSTGSTTSSAMGLPAGTYTVTVKDSNSCPATDTINIRVNTASSETAAQICIVTTDTGSMHNIIVWNKTGLAKIDSFKIYFYNSANQWQLIDAQPFAAAAQFLDMTPINDPNSNTVRYCLTAVDSCGNEEPIGSSPWQNTCHINQSPPGTFTWSGTGYLKQGVSQPVFTYYLLRDSLSNNHWRVIDSVSGSQNTMTDGVFQANPGNYPLARWRVNMVLNDSVNSGCSEPAELLRPFHSTNNSSTSRSNTSHNGTFTSVKQLANSSSVKAYPNPANTQLTIETGFANGQNGNVCLYNSLGEQITYTELNQHISVLPIADLPAGIYYYRVTDKNGTLVKADKVMVVH